MSFAADKAGKNFKEIGIYYNRTKSYSTAPHQLVISLWWYSFSWEW